MMIYQATRWLSSEGVYLFQVPEVGGILNEDTIMLLTSSLYAISTFFDQEHIKFNNEKLSIVRINFHPPITSEEPVENVPDYVIHCSSYRGLSLQSVFYSHMITNQMSEFEKAFLDSIVENIYNRLQASGRDISDIPYLQNFSLIKDVATMLEEVDTKFQSLVASWSLTQASNDFGSKFEFTNVLYNGKIRIEELFYDLGERAIESFNQLLMSKEEKITLYKIAKSLVSLSGLMYENLLSPEQDSMSISYSEIVLETAETKMLYRLDVRSYTIEEEAFCDITIMSN